MLWLEVPVGNLLSVHEVDCHHQLLEQLPATHHHETVCLTPQESNDQWSEQ